MTPITIKNFSELLALPPPKKLKQYHVARLTAPGENYGSIMLSVDIKIETLQGEEDVHVVAKMVPPNDTVQEIFNTSVTFRNEIAFYKNIVPTLREFQRENGVEEVDFCPEYFGSRLNLTGRDQVDSDAVLLLENLKVSNYVSIEPTCGLDLRLTRLVLKNLASLHSVPLALKLRNPEVFDKEIRPHLSPWMPKPEMHNTYRSAILRLISEMPEIAHLEDRILTGFDRELVPEETREPFATITHNDCWASNNLAKYHDGKATSCKLVDYQICGYGSPARDLVFFLFSSCQVEVLEGYLDELLRWYYDEFIANLRKLNCDLGKFGWEEFQKEVDITAKESQFGHVAFMLFVVFTAKDRIKDISEFSVENIIAGAGTEQHKRKFVCVIKEFAKRNWI